MNTVLYIAICDDSLLEGQAVTQLIDYFAQTRNIHVRYQLFQDAENMLRAIPNEKFTHYILDVMMPTMDGITAAQELRNLDTDAKIIFLTSSKEFAYQSYRVKAHDYLLKPLDSAEFLALLDQLQNTEDSSEACLVIPKGRSFFRISPKRLAYLEVNRKKLYFHLTDGQVWELTGTLAEFEQSLLSRPDFVKIHRAYIVNLNQISVLSPNGCIMLLGQNLPISRLLYNQVHDCYMNHLFGDTEV